MDQKRSTLNKAILQLQDVISSRILPSHRNEYTGQQVYQIDSPQNKETYTQITIDKSFVWFRLSSKYEIAIMEYRVQDNTLKEQVMIDVNNTSPSVLKSLAEKLYNKVNKL